MVPGSGKSPIGEPLSKEELTRLKAYHDIRASMAIINGFGQALDTSFHELVQCYQSAVAQLPPDVDAQIQELQHDCRFHLSRLVRAVDQLKERLDQDALNAARNISSDGDASQ